MGKTARPFIVTACFTVHPHACGENGNGKRKSASAARSTPTPVGKTDNVVGNWRTIRSTPTPVGKTSCAASSVVFQTVHPHACGENCLEVIGKFIVDGPPPRLWGKRRERQLSFILARSTPTPVGKTIRLLEAAIRRAVHPHACGENTDRCNQIGTEYGPPPRLWGKRYRPVSVSRLCGPPPRLWGKRLCHVVAQFPERSTPTPVGKTRLVVFSKTITTVHPHACGENDENLEIEWKNIGPPPRLWGKLEKTGTTNPTFRSTPTPVGKTSLVVALKARRAVHPHACGENILQLQLVSYPVGPPPRLWGKR